jgi:hypothetical protein
MLPPELEEVSALLARMEGPLEWFCEDADEVERLVRVAISKLDVTKDCRLTEIFPCLYNAYMEIISVETRTEFVDEIWRQVVRDEAKPEVLWAIAMLEEHHAPIADAVFAYVCIRSCMEGDAANATGELIDVMEGTDETVRRAGVFQALLRFGDEDVLDLLRQYRWELTFDEVAMVCGLPMHGRCLTTTFFLLEWAEEAEAEKDLARFKVIARAITPAPSKMCPSENGTSGVEGTADPGFLLDYEMVIVVPTQDLASVIEPRLRALARHEIGRPVMPAILERWGLAGGEGAD